MNEIGTFDILGPNMIGPSSSHTAGALRIAFVAGRMVEKAVSVKFVLYGSFPLAAWSLELLPVVIPKCSKTFIVKPEQSAPSVRLVPPYT